VLFLQTLRSPLNKIGKQQRGKFIQSADIYVFFWELITKNADSPFVNQRLIVNILFGRAVLFLVAYCYAAIDNHKLNIFEIRVYVAEISAAYTHIVSTGVSGAY
jgi:hypothetical protein